jgi:hypothetical protein
MASEIEKFVKKHLVTDEKSGTEPFFENVSILGAKVLLFKDLSGDFVLSVIDKTRDPEKQSWILE